MNMRKIVVSTLIGVTIFTGSIGFSHGLDYKVQSGDTFWIISEKFGVDIHSLMEANNANEGTMLYVGQNLVIPVTSDNNVHTVKSGDTLWIISQKYDVDIFDLMKINNINENTVLNIGEKLTIPTAKAEGDLTTYTVTSGDTFWKISQKLGVSLNSLLAVNSADGSEMLLIGQKLLVPDGDSEQIPNEPSEPQSNEPYITYEKYTVQKGDNPWSISQKMGIPYNELLNENNLSESSTLNIGDVLKIPVHNVPIKPTPGPQYGELLEWWKEAQYVIPVNAVFKVVDFNTGKYFMAKRTTGANHADVEALTQEDTIKMKEIWGGSLSWTSRPVIIEYNGRRIAASAASLPHAGNDKVAGGIYTSWRSDGYGAGYNFDWVKNNGMDGVFDIHFLNSTRHNDGQVDPQHQENIKIAAGIK